MKKIQSDKIGEISYEEKDIINFPKGLYGFEEYHQYLLVRNVQNEMFFFLQSVEEPSLMFVLVSPNSVFPDYELEIHESEVEGHDLDSIVDFCIVTIPEDTMKSTINLLGPVIIDVDQQVGKQTISLNQNNSTKHPLVLSEKKEAAIV